MDSVSPQSESDRMLVAMIDVSGMSAMQVRSLEESIKGYAHTRYVSTEVFDGGPVSLRVCAFEPLTGFPEDEGRRTWRPVEVAA